MTYSLEQIADIIIKNPNSDKIKIGRQKNEKALLHVYGVGLNNAIKRSKNVENRIRFEIRQQYAQSNRDLFKRILADEAQVFTTRGGSTNFIMKDASLEPQMASAIADVINGLSLHRWVETYALKAFEVDPMSVIFMEMSRSNIGEVEGKVALEPICYPTYKSITDIYDYENVGRSLNYIVFEIPKSQYLRFGIDETELQKTAQNYNNTSIGGKFYRFVDSEQDIIVTISNSIAIPVPLKYGFENPIKHTFGIVPAIIVSDIISFTEPDCYESPLADVIELADTVLFEKSVTSVVRKLHGFSKAYEPLLDCDRCSGEGTLNGAPCPQCTPVGKSVGSGKKLRTLPEDVLRIPKEAFIDNPKLNVSNMFGYIAPPIDGFKMAEDYIDKLEKMMYCTYWSMPMTQDKAISDGSKNKEKTATEIIVSYQPKYAVLNTKADWVERIEKWIADRIGGMLFPNYYVRAMISLGRNYILESPEDVLRVYYEMKKNGCAECILSDQLEKYELCLYQKNPDMQAKALKIMSLTPFLHTSTLEIEQSPYVLFEDKVRKRYIGEYLINLSINEILSKTKDQIKIDFFNWMKNTIGELRTQFAEEQALKEIAPPQVHESIKVE